MGPGRWSWAGLRAEHVLQVFRRGRGHNGLLVLSRRDGHRFRSRGRQRQWGWLGPGDLAPGAPARVDVPGLTNRQTAGDTRVSGPGVLDTGRPFVTPHPADDLGRGLD